MEDKLVGEIKHKLQGTCKSVTAIIEEMELDCTDEDLEEELLNVNLEICPTCGWWVESYELVNPETEDTDDHCENCRDYKNSD